MDFEEVAVTEEHQPGTVHVSIEKLKRFTQFDINRLLTVSVNHSSGVNFCDSSQTTAKTIITSAYKLVRIEQK